MEALGGHLAEELEILVRKNQDNKVELLKKINLYDYFKKEPLMHEGFIFDDMKTYFPKTVDMPQETFWLEITNGVQHLESSNLYSQIQKVRSQLSWIVNDIKFGRPEQQMRVMERIWDLYLELSVADPSLRKAFFKLRDDIAKQPPGWFNPSKNYRIKKLKEEISRWIKEMFYDKARSEKDIMIAVARASFVIPNFLRLVYEARKSLEKFVNREVFKGFFIPEKHPYTTSVAKFNEIFGVLQRDIFLFDMMAIKHPLKGLPLNLLYKNVAKQDKDKFIDVIEKCKRKSAEMKEEIKIKPTMDEFVMNDCGGHAELEAPTFSAPVGRGDVGFFLAYLIKQTRDLLENYEFAKCQIGLSVDEYTTDATVPHLDTAVEWALGELGCYTGNMQMDYEDPNKSKGSK